MYRILASLIVAFVLSACGASAPVRETNVAGWAPLLEETEFSFADTSVWFFPEKDCGLTVKTDQPSEAGRYHLEAFFELKDGVPAELKLNEDSIFLICSADEGIAFHLTSDLVGRE